LRAILLDGTRLALGLVGGVTICLIAFGDRLVDLWMGGGFSDSILPLYVLSLAGVVMVGQGPAGSILLATGRHRLVAAASIADIVLRLALTMLLVPRYGLLGVAVGTALPYVVLNAAVLVPVACRDVSVRVPTFAATVMTPTLVAALPAALVALLVRSAAAPASLTAVMGQSALVATVYLSAFCLLGLRSSDRARYAGSVKQMAGVTP
jgi:O-antigen/teichoic acid export membrane protein